MYSPNRLDVATFAKLIGMKEAEVEKRIKSRAFKVYYVKGKRLEGRQPFKNTAIMKREARAIVNKLAKEGKLKEAATKKILASLGDVTYTRGAKVEAKVTKATKAAKVTPKAKARKVKNVVTLPPVPKPMSGESK